MKGVKFLGRNVKKHPRVLSGSWKKGGKNV